MKHLLRRTGQASLNLFTAIAIIGGLSAGGVLIYAGLQLEDSLRLFLCGSGLILILYSLSHLA